VRTEFGLARPPFQRHRDLLSRQPALGLDTLPRASQLYRHLRRYAFAESSLTNISVFSVADTDLDCDPSGSGGLFRLRRARVCSPNMFLRRRRCPCVPALPSVCRNRSQAVLWRYEKACGIHAPFEVGGVRRPRGFGTLMLADAIVPLESVFGKN